MYKCANEFIILKMENFKISRSVKMTGLTSTKRV